MSNFDYKITYGKNESGETMSGAAYDFFGDILPDFGFPDKQMNNILKDIWPDDMWDRGQVYDLYKWYQTGIKQDDQPPFDVDSSFNPIYQWLQDNTPYPDAKVNHFMAVFKRGIDEGWIKPMYVGTTLAPEHEASKIASTIAWLPRGVDNMKWLLLAGTGLIVAYYGMPLVASSFKSKARKKR